MLYTKNFFFQIERFTTELSDTQHDKENSINQVAQNHLNDNGRQNQNELFSEDSQVFSSSIPTTQDLLNICSGEFSGITQVSETNLKHDSLAMNNNLETITLKEKENERKSLDIEHDVIISQLLDEEEMEKFKKKFDSPDISNTQKRLEEADIHTSEVEDIHIRGILDSEDDDEDEMKIKRKKNKSKLTFSGEFKMKYNIFL